MKKRCSVQKMNYAEAALIIPIKEEPNGRKRDHLRTKVKQQGGDIVSRGGAEYVAP